MRILNNLVTSWFVSYCLIVVILPIADTACDPPTKFKALLNIDTGNIELSWDPNENVTSYFLYGAAPATITLTSGTTSYEVANTDLRVTYTFRIIARCGTRPDSTSSAAAFGPAIFSRIGAESVDFRWQLADIRPTELVDVQKSSSLLFAAQGRDILTTYETIFKGRITYTGDIATGWMTFNLRNITKYDAGYFKSAQSTTTNGGQVLVVIDKPTKPVIRKLGQPIVGQPFALICDSQSTSKPDFYKPELKYNWYINGSIHVYDARHYGRFSSRGNVLNVSEIQKVDKAHSFKCQSSDNSLTSEDSNTESIDPLYGPDTVTLDPTTKRYNVEVGKSLGPVTCTADCNPPCTYEWKWRLNNATDRKTVSNTNILSKTSVRRQDEGEYRCNALQKSSGVLPKRKVADIFLNVLYQAEIKEITYYVNSNPPVVYDRDLVVSESDRVIIQCKVDGDPVPKISWDFNRTPLVTGKSVDRSLRKEFQSVHCNETGVYTCTGDNGIKVAATKSIQMRVKCSPRKDYRVTATLKYGLKLGESVNINASVIGYPKPTGRWFTNASGVVTGVRTVDINLYTFTYSGTVTVQNQTDFGKYWIELNNNIGNVEKIYFEINAQDRPQVPRNFTVHEVYTEMANLSWLSEFDGGQKQTFLIEYSVKGDNSDKYLMNVTDEGFGKTINTTIFNLKADTLYHFRLYSRNDIGNSSMAKELEIRTKAYPVPDSQSDGAGGIIAGVVVVAVILVVVIVGAIYFLNRRFKKTSKIKTKKGPNNTEVMYAVVNKSDRNDNNYKEDATIYENAPGPSTTNKKTAPKQLRKNEDVEYANSAQKNRYVNEEGCVYMDVEVSTKNNKKRGRPLIHGDDSRTEYMSIDFNRKGEPLLESDNEDNDGGPDNDGEGSGPNNVHKGV